MNAGEFRRVLESIDVDTQRRFVRELPDGAELALELPQGAISSRACAAEIVEMLERRGLLGCAAESLPPWLSAARHHRRARVLAAIRRRCDAVRYVMRGFGRLPILLRDVYVEPRLRFRGTPLRDGGESGAKIDRTTCVREAETTKHDKLDVWIRRADRPRLLTVFGEMGAGKSAMLLQQEAAFLWRAEQDRGAALALLVEAKTLVRTGSLSAAAADRLGLQESDVSIILADPEIRCVVFLDGADEVPSAAIEDTLGKLSQAPSTVEAIVVTSRPVYRFPAFHGEEATLAPWDESELGQFLDRCEPRVGAEVAALRALLARQPLPFLTNPLAATMCLLVAREEGAMMGNRSQILGVLIEKLFDQYARERPTSLGEQRISWADVAPLVCELAYEYVRHGLALTFDKVRGLLRRKPHGAHQIHTVEGFLDSELGVFVRVTGGYEFAFRGIAEFLAGLHLLLQDTEAMVRAASTTWGQEPVRQAIGWAHASDPERAGALLAALLGGEEQECVGVEHRCLRRVIVATHIAVDLGEDGPHASQLAAAVTRRLCDERSTWVGERMAEAVRVLSRFGGPVFRQLLAIAQALLQTQEGSRAGYFEWLANHAPPADPMWWLLVLCERDAEVRMAAIRQLETAIGEPLVQRILLTMLFDDGEVEFDRVAYHAGHALRAAPRDEHFAEVREYLQWIVGLGAQMLSSAAALALHPDEAPLETLVLALKEGIADGPRYVGAVTALAGSDEGRRTLDARWEGWEEKLQGVLQHTVRPMPKMARWPVPTSAIRRRWARALAPGLGFAAAPELDTLLADGDFVHGCTHEFEFLPPPVVDRVVARQGRWSLCANALAALARRIEREATLGTALIARGEELLAGTPSRAELRAFPGRALEGMVRAGDRAALQVYVGWLPRSSYANGTSEAYDQFPADLCRMPEVRRALEPCIDDAAEKLSRSRSGPAALALGRFPEVWSERAEMWAELDRLLGELRVPLGATQWNELNRLLSCLRAVELVAPTRSRLVAIFDALMMHHPTGRTDECFFWHQQMGHVLRFVVERGLVAELAAPLLAMSGVGRPPVCRKWQLHAVCAAWSLLDPATRVECSTVLASTLRTRVEPFDVPTNELYRVIEVAPGAWSEACAPLIDEWKHSRVPVRGEVIVAVLEGLPVADRRSALAKWLPLARGWLLPWIEDGDHKLHRPLDEAWRMLFDAGLDGEEFVLPAAAASP